MTMGFWFVVAAVIGLIARESGRWIGQASRKEEARRIAEECVEKSARERARLAAELPERRFRDICLAKIARVKRCIDLEY